MILIDVKILLDVRSRCCKGLTIVHACAQGLVY